jgi:hypothetical protein
MTHQRNRLLSYSVGLLMLWAPWCQAEIFKCKHPDGTTYFSDRSCVGGAVLPGQNVQPKAEASEDDPLPPPSAECQRLRAALTRLQRTSSYDAPERSRVQDSYDSRCRQPEQAARERARRNAYKAAKLREDEQQRADIERERRATEQAQCVELGGIIRAKRSKLSSMTPGERSDFERSSSAFDQRCKGV